MGFEDFLAEESILTEVSLKTKRVFTVTCSVMLQFVLKKLSVISTLDNILPCGTKFVRVQFLAIFPAIRKTKPPQTFFGTVF